MFSYSCLGLYPLYIDYVFCNLNTAFSAIVVSKFLALQELRKNLLRINVLQGTVAV
jgi:hypothetical protein